VRFNPVPISDAAGKRIESAKPGQHYWRDALGGRASSHGEFPAIFVREEFVSDGFNVLLSEPRLPDEVRKTGQLTGGYALLSFPGHRKWQHQRFCSFYRMLEIFGPDRIERLLKEVAKTKKRHGWKSGGGDPDMFVYKPDDSRNRFFVEVKDVGDTQRAVQECTFPLIEKYLECEVRIYNTRPLGWTPTQHAVR
jgi:hypothetical protein